MYLQKAKTDRLLAGHDVADAGENMAGAIREAGEVGQLRVSPMTT